MLRCSAWAEARAAPRRGALFRVEIVCESRFIKVGHEPGSCATCADQVYGFRSGPSPGAGSGACMLRWRIGASVEALRLPCRSIGSSGSHCPYIDLKLNLGNSHVRVFVRVKSIRRCQAGHGSV